MLIFIIFFFNDTATTEIYTLSLHDALPIYTYRLKLTYKTGEVRHLWIDARTFLDAKIEGTPRRWDGKTRTVATYFRDYKPDRKSTRLNSSHQIISYAVFCLKKKITLQFTLR